MTGTSGESWRHSYNGWAANPDPCSDPWVRTDRGLSLKKLPQNNNFCWSASSANDSHQESWRAYRKTDKTNNYQVIQKAASMPPILTASICLACSPTHHLPPYRTLTELEPPALNHYWQQLFSTVFLPHLLAVKISMVNIVHCPNCWYNLQVLTDYVLLEVTTIGKLICKPYMGNCLRTQSWTLVAMMEQEPKPWNGQTSR